MALYNCKNLNAIPGPFSFALAPATAFTRTGEVFQAESANRFGEGGVENKLRVQGSGGLGWDFRV